MTTELLGMRSSGEGTIHFDLEKLFPSWARIDIETEKNLRLESAGVEQKRRVTSTETMVIESLN